MGVGGGKQTTRGVVGSIRGAPGLPAIPAIRMPGENPVNPRSPTNPALRALAAALLLVGVALTVGALFADALGISEVGGKSGDGLGWTQLVAVIVGLVLLLVGAAWLLNPPFGRSADDLTD